VHEVMRSKYARMRRRTISTLTWSGDSFRVFLQLLWLHMFHSFLLLCIAILHHLIKTSAKELDSQLSQVARMGWL